MHIAWFYIKDIFHEWKWRGLFYSHIPIGNSNDGHAHISVSTYLSTYLYRFSCGLNLCVCIETVLTYMPSTCISTLGRCESHTFSRNCPSCFYCAITVVLIFPCCSSLPLPLCPHPAPTVNPYIVVHVHGSFVPVH